MAGPRRVKRSRGCATPGEMEGSGCVLLLLCSSAGHTRIATPAGKCMCGLGVHVACRVSFTACGSYISMCARQKRSACVCVCF